MMPKVMEVVAENVARYQNAHGFGMTMHMKVSPDPNPGPDPTTNPKVFALSVHVKAGPIPNPNPNPNPRWADPPELTSISSASGRSSGAVDDERDVVVHLASPPLPFS